MRLERESYWDCRVCRSKPAVWIWMPYSEVDDLRCDDCVDRNSDGEVIKEWQEINQKVIL